MKKNEIFTAVYRVVAPAIVKEASPNALDEFIAKISAYAIVFKYSDYGVVITASSDALSGSELSNIAYKFFKDDYYLETLGLLGPFKK